jgi:hypothetical protein
MHGLRPKTVANAGHQFHIEEPPRQEAVTKHRPDFVTAAQHLGATLGVIDGQAKRDRGARCEQAPQVVASFRPLDLPAKQLDPRAKRALQPGIGTQLFCKEQHRFRWGREVRIQISSHFATIVHGTKQALPHSFPFTHISREPQYSHATRTQYTESLEHHKGIVGASVIHELDYRKGMLIQKLLQGSRFESSGFIPRRDNNG